MPFDFTPGPLVEPLEGRRWESAEIRTRVIARVAELRGTGLGQGDRVFLVYRNGNSPQFFVDLIAVWTLGGCACPVDHRLTAFELETLTRFAAPRMVLTDSDPNPAIPHCAPADGGKRADTVSRIDPDRDALIPFTSGTTGQPKAVVHTHQSLRARWRSLRE